MILLKSIGLIVILVTTPVYSQTDNDFLDSIEALLSQQQASLNETTQSRNNNDELCIHQLEAVLSDVGKFQNWALKSIIIII